MEKCVFFDRLNRNTVANQKAFTFDTVDTKASRNIGEIFF